MFAIGNYGRWSTHTYYRQRHPNQRLKHCHVTQIAQNKCLCFDFAAVYTGSVLTRPIVCHTLAFSSSYLRSLLRTDWNGYILYEELRPLREYSPERTNLSKWRVLCVLLESTREIFCISSVVQLPCITELRERFRLPNLLTNHTLTASYESMTNSLISFTTPRLTCAFRATT